MTALCACGAPYEPTASGRQNHRTLHGHAPAVEKKVDAWREAVRIAAGRAGGVR